MRNISKHYGGGTRSGGSIFACRDFELLFEEVDLANRLRNHEDGLAISWGKKGIVGIRNSLDAPPTEYLLSSSEKDIMGSCARCALSRTSIIAKTETSRSD